MNYRLRTGAGFSQCVIKPRRKASCQAFGNGHFISFDGARFNSTATCLLTMARTKSDATIPEFLIQVDMQPSSNSNLSSVAQVIMKAENFDMVMAQGRRVLINGKDVTIGSVIGDVAVRRIGRDVAVVFKFGMVLRWDGRQNLRIEARRPLAKQIEGLCGDFDEDETNDFQTPQGIIESDLSVFVNSWRQEGSNSGCRLQAQPKSPCDSLEGLEKYKARCEVKYNVDVPSYARCNLFEYCLFEMCATGGDIEYIESTIYTFFETCNEEYSSVEDVTLEIPEIACSGNSHFNSCMSQCQATCSDHTAMNCLSDENMKDGCVPGCQCDEGYILDGDLCVKTEDCGCVGSEGEYYPNGYDSYLEDCHEKCQCKNGDLFCESSSCMEKQYCGFRDDVYGCHWEDECKNSNGGCEHYCNWDNGRVICSCREGYNLTADGKTCTALMSACEESLKNFTKWRSNAMQHWLDKLDAYMDAMREGETVGKPAHVCKSAWTQWFDRDDPEGSGDDESLEKIREEMPSAVCQSPVAVEAQLTDGRSIFSTGLIFRTMSKEEGLLCLHSDQRKGEFCGDFRIRFLCLEELV